VSTCLCVRACEQTDIPYNFHNSQKIMHFGWCRHIWFKRFMKLVWNFHKYFKYYSWQWNSCDLLKFYARWIFMKSFSWSSFMDLLAYLVGEVPNSEILYLLTNCGTPEVNTLDTYYYIIAIEVLTNLISFVMSIQTHITTSPRYHNTRVSSNL